MVQVLVDSFFVVTKL